MLYLNTVTPLLRSALETLMVSDVFSSFRLVGGTGLSLQIGHRMSDDIDLFTDAPYGSIDFDRIDSYLHRTFPYVDDAGVPLVAMGKSYAVGNDRQNTVKLDLYYTDNFIREVFEIERIRMAGIDDIIAMKIDVIQRIGRKKDFWDLHELLDKYAIGTMLLLHKERYPYGHDANLILSNLKNFDKADKDFNPVCLKGKYWEVVKWDMAEAVNNYQISS